MIQKIISGGQTGADRMARDSGNNSKPQHRSGCARSGCKQREVTPCKFVNVERFNADWLVRRHQFDRQTP
jgi:hypothetical protein